MTDVAMLVTYPHSLRNFYSILWDSSTLHILPHPPILARPTGTRQISNRVYEPDSSQTNLFTYCTSLKSAFPTDLFPNVLRSLRRLQALFEPQWLLQITESTELSHHLLKLTFAGSATFREICATKYSFTPSSLALLTFTCTDCYSQLLGNSPHTVSFSPP